MNVNDIRVAAANLWQRIRSLRNTVRAQSSDEALAKAELAMEPMFDTREMIYAGTILLVISFGAFAAWAGLAPLEGAAIAVGSVKVSGERQSVQHLEGGIIKEIVVEEGSKVEAGQVLLRLDPTQPMAARGVMEGKLVSLEAVAARLRAERDGLGDVEFPQSLIEKAMAIEDEDVIGGERRVFSSRREALTGQRQILEQRKARLREEIDAYRAQKKSAEEELRYLNEELAAVTVIYEKGIYEKPKYLALKRAVASEEGEIGRLKALVARTQQQIGEADLEIIDLDNQWASRVASELQTTMVNLLDIRERIQAIDDVLLRLDVVAPQSGVVVGLKYHTVGGVISPGDRILDIVPSDAALVVEVRVRPEDIDVVGPGMPCDVRLTAYNYRSTPALAGKVVLVSADSFFDEKTQAAYFRALIEVDEGEMAELGDVTLFPGMPAEVFIKTGARSALDYLLEPITNSLRRSLRE